MRIKRTNNRSNAARRVRTTAVLAGLAAVAAMGVSATSALAQEKHTIALIPGLTTDAFYITMRKGAQAAADAARALRDTINRHR